MTKFSCPSCGAEVRFQSSVSVFAVCQHCRSMLVRHDLDLDSLGVAAALASDMSPLQLGTQGRHEGKDFTLIGRLKISWSEGFWNEWFALFIDGGSAWLGEAQGFYAITREIPAPAGLPSPDNLTIGQLIEISGGAHQVDDIKEITCVGSEGELPFQAVSGWRATSVDLNGPRGSFACIEYSDEGIRLFTGKYVQFQDLKLNFLRQLDGW